MSAPGGSGEVKMVIKVPSHEYFEIQDWISVQDRLPDSNGRYLVYEPDLKWVLVSGFIRGQFTEGSATHWMPLPSPPVNETQSVAGTVIKRFRGVLKSLSDK